LSPISSRRKRGLLIGFGLMSAAALVAFGTSRARTRHRPTDPESQNGDGPAAETAASEPTLLERAREMAQAAWLLVTQRRPNDA
jgi:hypothetical protein